MPQFITLLVVALFPVLVIAGALKDLTSFTIPNWLTGALALAFIPAALCAGLDLPSLGLHAAVGFAFLVAGMAMFAFGTIGGGDAKLFAATALWLGWPASLHFLLYTSLAGGVLALLLVSIRHTHLELLTMRGPPWVLRLAEKTGPAPYGVAIAVGALAAFPHSQFLAVLGASV